MKIIVGMLCLAMTCTETSASSFQEKLDGALSSFDLVIPPGKLTPDGRWLVYQYVTSDRRRVRPKPTWQDTVIVVRSTHDETERRYAAGDVSYGGGEWAVSPSGRWLAFRKAPRLRSSVESTSVPRTSVMVVEIATGEMVEYPERREFSFATDRTGQEWIVLQSYGSAHEESVSNLTVYRLGVREQVAELEGVRAFVMNPPKTRFAWIDAVGLHDYEIDTQRRRTLDQGGREYRSLMWSDAGNALAALRGEGSGYALMTVTHLAARTPRKRVFAAEDWEGFPPKHEISPDFMPLEGISGESLLKWRANEEGIFFRIRPVDGRNKHPDTMPDLVLWHWRDEMPPHGPGDHRDWQPSRTYLSFVSLAEGRFVQLEDAALREVRSHGRGRWVVGLDLRPYEDPSLIAPYMQRDVYRVDLRTGQRALIVKGLWIAKNPYAFGLFGYPQMSPDGEVMLYQGNDGGYHAYELSSGRRRDLTAKLPWRVHIEAGDRRHQRALLEAEGWLKAHVLQGWTGDGEHVLISDGRDVWALALKDGVTRNLTGNGWEEEVVYERTILQGFFHALQAQEPVDLQEPLYFLALNRGTGNSGLARRMPENARLELLHWVSTDRPDYYKAAQAPVYVIRSNTADDYNYQYYRLDDTWQPAVRLTDLNPLARDLGRRQPVYLSYPGENGKTWKAVLVPPLDPSVQPPYPTIADIYQHLDLGPHASLLGGSHTRGGIFVENGYALLAVHIQPRLRAAGAAAVEGVQRAVEAAVAAGVADPEHLGLTGYSYGGYETNFIITQTDLFRAAVARAGMTELLSHCNKVYLSGMSGLDMCAHAQPHMGSVEWWKELPVYLANSPLHHAQNIKTPLLLVHGDRDDAARFNQPVGLFDTLRYMRDKPVVLLQYSGHDHVLTPEVIDDIDMRMLQFFDHFLKGAPAPMWWADGISYTKGQAPTVLPQAPER